MTTSIQSNKKDFILNAMGLTLNSFNSFFFLIIVRYINGLDVAGIFTYTFAICSLLYILATYFNRSFQMSNYSEKHFSFNDFLTCRIITATLSLVIVLLFSFINHFSSFEILIITLLMLFRITESISDCFYGAIHQKHFLYKTGLSLTIKAVIGLLVFFTINLISHNLLLAILALIVINIIVFLFYDLPNYRKLYQKPFHLSLSNLKNIFKICFPVFLFSALSLYLSNCQKYILPYFEPNESQTIFGILVMPATILSLIGSYLINPSINTLTEYYKTNNWKSYIKISQKILGIVAAIGIIAVLACYLIGIPILNFIYQLDLSIYKLPLTIILIGAIFFAISMIISSLLTILEENRRQTYIYIAISIITTIFSIFLIQYQGIAGAAYAFLVSSLLLTFSYISLLQIKLHRLGNRREQ